MKNLNLNIKFALGEQVGTTGWISNYIKDLKIEIRSTKVGLLDMYCIKKEETTFKSRFLCGQMDEQLADNVRTGVLQERDGLAVVWECLEATENLNHHEDFFIEHATPAGQKLVWKFLQAAVDSLNEFIESYDTETDINAIEIKCITT